MSALDSPIVTLYRFEMRMLLRDRRTLFASVILPLLILPLIFTLGRWAEAGRQERAEARIYSFAFVGEDSEHTRALLDEIAAATDDGTLQLEEKSHADPAAALAGDELHFYIELVPNEPRTDAIEDGGPPFLRLVFRSDWDASATATNEMAERLAALQQARRATVLAEGGFPVPLSQVAAVEEIDVATAAAVAGATLGRWAVVALMMILMVGGSVVAADAIAGEKERGTLETLLTTAASRAEIVIAKQLLIFTFALAIAVVQILNLLVYVGFDWIELPLGFAVDLSPASGVLLLVLLLPLMVLTASLLLLISGYVKSYKEFQLYLFPLLLLTLIPAGAALLPGIELRSAVVLVPIANLSVAVREVLTGRIDLPFLGLAWLISAGLAVGLGRLTMTVLATERLITANDTGRGEIEGGAALFPRRVLRWFAVMWALVLLAASSLEPLRQLRAQVLFNVVGVFLGASLWMLHRYRLPITEVLSLRRPRPMVWPAVVLAAPAGLLVTVLIGQLSLALFPIPESLLEELGRFLAPQDMPLWELIIWLAILPGLCEEIAFRGVLLYGLRDRLRPLARVLIVGAIFGLFHFELARLLPTAFMGVLLAALTLLTGSIFPAMLWHALNNASALAAERLGLDLGDLDPKIYAAAVAIEILAWVWIWRAHRQHPRVLPQ